MLVVSRIAAFAINSPVCKAVLAVLDANITLFISKLCIILQYCSSRVQVTLEQDAACQQAGGLDKQIQKVRLGSSSSDYQVCS